MRHDPVDNFREFVAEFSALHGRAAGLPLGEFSDAAPTKGNCGKSVMLFSPHPDDEALIGAVALRLRQELGARIVNVAVTLGSDPSRKEERRRELEAACRTLGFELLVPGESALDGMNIATRDGEAEMWQANVAVIEGILTAALPDVVMFPHANDFNSSHIGVHHVLMDALARLQTQTPEWAPLIIETEWWHAMDTPNLLIGLSAHDEARLVYAIAAHTGEVQRNPYHVMHPARMMDNVGRGSEVVGGQGGPAVNMEFAMIYRASKLAQGVLVPLYPHGRVFSPEDSLEELLGL